jgi:hypothetical protein
LDLPENLTVLFRLSYALRVMHRSTWTVLALVGAGALGCGPSYTKDDSTANGIAVRREAVVLDNCGQDDAGTCTPAMVRANTTVAFCANQREVTVHGAPFDGGVPCQAR